MIVKIKKSVTFGDSLGNLELALNGVIKDIQPVIELIQKVKEEEELSDNEYARLLSLMSANSCHTSVNRELVAQLFFYQK